MNSEGDGDDEERYLDGFGGIERVTWVCESTTLCSRSISRCSGSDGGGCSRRGARLNGLGGGVQLVCLNWHHQRNGSRGRRERSVSLAITQVDRQRTPTDIGILGLEHHDRARAVDGDVGAHASEQRSVSTTAHHEAVGMHLLDVVSASSEEGTVSKQRKLQLERQVLPRPRNVQQHRASIADEHRARVADSELLCSNAIGRDEIVGALAVLQRQALLDGLVGVRCLGDHATEEEQVAFLIHHAHELLEHGLAARRIAHGDEILHD